MLARLVFRLIKECVFRHRSPFVGRTGSEFACHRLAGYFGRIGRQLTSPTGELLVAVSEIACVMPGGLPHSLSVVAYGYGLRSLQFVLIYNPYSVHGDFFHVPDRPGRRRDRPCRGSCSQCCGHTHCSCCHRFRCRQLPRCCFSVDWHGHGPALRRTPSHRQGLGEPHDPGKALLIRHGRDRGPPLQSSVPAFLQYQLQLPHRSAPRRWCSTTPPARGGYWVSCTPWRSPTSPATSAPGPRTRCTVQGRRDQQLHGDDLHRLHLRRAAARRVPRRRLHGRRSRSSGCHDNIWQLTAAAQTSRRRTDACGRQFDPSVVTRSRTRARRSTRHRSTAAASWSTRHCRPGQGHRRCHGRAPRRHDVPWALRRATSPTRRDPVRLHDGTDRYLIFSDLLFDALAPHRGTRHRALVRIEDVGPDCRPARAAAVADYLARRRSRSRWRSTPATTTRMGVNNNGKAAGLHAADRPQVVSAIKYTHVQGRNAAHARLDTPVRATSPTPTTA